MNRAFQFLTISIFLILLLPWLIQDGMFMDGMIYATVAKNLAYGQGSWWHLHLTSFLSAQYYDQPPLTIWITSFFFKVLGKSLYIERIYSLLTAIINLILIKNIWKILFNKEKSLQSFWWLPVLFWIICPACFWSFTNNMEENTMSIFILSSVIFLLNGFYLNQRPIRNTIFMAIAIFLAAMCKGVQGTFTLTGIILIGFTIKQLSIKESIAKTLLLFSVFAAIITLLFQYSPALEYFENYYKVRIVNTFSNPNSATTDTHFYLLFRLAMEELIPLAICSLIIFTARKNKIQVNQHYKSLALLFLLLALAGTLPLLLTAEQRRFYLVPVYPLFSLSLSLLVINHLKGLFEKYTSKIKIKTIQGISILIITLTIFLTVENFGKAKRDQIILHDIHLVGENLSDIKIISIDPSLYSNWSLHLYFKRYYDISLNPNIEHGEYFLNEKNKSEHPTGFSDSELRLLEYKLWISDPTNQKVITH